MGMQFGLSPTRCTPRPLTRAHGKPPTRENLIPSEARTSAPLSGLHRENLLFVSDADLATSYVEGCNAPEGVADGRVFFCALVFPTVKYLRIFSSRLGPMPLMARKSSTLLNGPYDLRICKIFSAVTGPIPGTCCSSSEFAVLMLTGAGGGFFLAARLPAVAQSSPSKRRIVVMGRGTIRG